MNGVSGLAAVIAGGVALVSRLYTQLQNTKLTFTQLL